MYNQLAYSAKPEVSCVRSCRQKASRPELIEPLLDKFEAAKLIDDAEYAQMFVAQKSRTKKLPRRAAS